MLRENLGKNVGATGAIVALKTGQARRHCPYKISVFIYLKNTQLILLGYLVGRVALSVQGHAPYYEQHFVKFLYLSTLSQFD